MRVLLTGATGFIGSRLAQLLDDAPGVELTCAVRRAGSSCFGREVVVDGLAADTDWSAALKNQQVVIHLAARAHLSQGQLSDTLVDCRKVNVDGALNLARQAAETGTHRLIFISTASVNGPGSTGPLTELDEPTPADPLSRFKLEAEIGLWKVRRDSGMQLVIVRPVLVYGPGAPGNFGALVKWVAKGVPLPFGAVHNLRSYIALDNLVDLIVTCIDHPAAADQVFLVSDGDDLSTTDLLKTVATAMGKPARLVPVPTGLLMFAATVLGKKTLAHRLLGFCQVDIAKVRHVLGWQPPVSVKDGLNRAVSDRLGSPQNMQKSV